jgi:hypothetical protein
MNYILIRKAMRELEITQGRFSESVNRKTDNTMTNIKSTKGQTTIYERRI